VAHVLERLRDALADRYALDRELGHGGMATVYLARDLKHDRLVALKVLHPELAGALGPDRFLREIQIAASLSHPHILPVHDSGVAGGLLYYVMPYVEGESLRARLNREKQLPIEDALQITRQVAAALAYAHQRGIIHRDIKPENILLESGEAVVADFGIAQAVGMAGGSRLTETGIALGTPSYMSPEQAAGSRDLDGRSDVYALACVLYEMLAGHPPFMGTSAQEIAARHALDPVPSLRVARGTVPAPVERGMLRALAKVPADRFPTAAQFTEALAAPAEQQFRAPDRHLLAFVAPAALLLLAVLAYFRWPRSKVELDPDLVAVIPFRVQGAVPALGYLREGMIDLVAAKLTGEGGARAADPRSVMTAWRHTVTSESEDLSEHAALDLARRLGAGQLLLGGVVGTPSRLILNASLLQSQSGRPQSEVNVEGPADSLPLLVDRLIAQLIAGDAGKQSGLSGWADIPLPALRLYLEGQAAHRRGDYPQAVAHFQQALEIDSTFGPAALNMAMASAWTAIPGAARRGLELAWAGRARLNARARALLSAEVGPRYPALSSLVDYLGAWERAVDVAPDLADRWYELGDVYFHEGRYLGIGNWLQRASEAFRRAVALDSSTAPLGHLLETTVLQGDTAAVRRLGASYVMRDSTGELLDFYRWRIASGLNDTSALRQLEGRFSQMTLPSLWRIMSHAVLDGNHLDDADRAAAAIRARAGRGSEWERSKVYLRAFELNRGRPRAALADTAAADEEEYGPHAGLYQRVLDALFWDGDSTSGAQAAGEVLGLATRPTATGGRELATQDTDLCVAELWRLSRGELHSAGRTIARLRGGRLSDSSSQSLSPNNVCATILAAILAQATRAPDAAALLRQLDSLIRIGPDGLRNGPAVALTLSPAFIKSTRGITPCGFEDFANLIVARLYEREGNPQAALAAVRRQSYAYHHTEFFASHLREEGRLAGLTGDRFGAIRAYRHYLSLRADPEPALRPEVERIRAELAALQGTH
jgi:eukaryotic-like serine/threonine-protein kinase